MKQRIIIGGCFVFLIFGVTWLVRSSSAHEINVTFCRYMDPGDPWLRGFDRPPLPSDPRVAVFAVSNATHRSLRYIESRIEFRVAGRWVQDTQIPRLISHSFPTEEWFLSSNSFTYICFREPVGTDGWRIRTAFQDRTFWDGAGLYGCVVRLLPIHRLAPKLIGVSLETAR